MDKQKNFADHVVCQLNYISDCYIYSNIGEDKEAGRKLLLKLWLKTDSPYGPGLIIPFPSMHRKFTVSYAHIYLTAAPSEFLCFGGAGLVLRSLLPPKSRWQGKI